MVPTTFAATHAAVGVRLGKLLGSKLGMALGMELGVALGKLLGLELGHDGYTKFIANCFVLSLNIDTSTVSSVTLESLVTVIVPENEPVKVTTLPEKLV